jgi:hypothetical protein
VRDDGLMRKLALGFLVAMSIVLGAAGVQAQLEQSGDLTDHLDSLIVSMPATRDGGDYLQPNADSRALWREIIDHILAGEYEDAHTKALTKNYELVLFTDTATPDSVVHSILERTLESTSRHWGTFVFNTSPLRPHLVIQSPHSRFDTNTGYESVRVYQHADGRALFISGAHRCNGLTDSPCDGTTSVCGGSLQPYRYSDQAHVVLATFQIATEAMLEHDPALVVVQPHGFAQLEGDPDLILSNGTRTMPTGMDYAVAIRDAIQAVDPSLTAKVGHIDLSWTRLLGGTNTQGRLVNGSADPCGTGASSATGQFVHIEQTKPGLRDSSQNWMKLAQAVANTVPVEATSVHGSVTPPAGRILGNYPNPFPSRTRVAIELGHSAPIELDVFDVAGRRVVTLASGTHPAGVHSLVWNAGQVPSGVYFLRLQHGGEMDRRRCVLVH